jgi:galactokinase
MAVTVDVLLAIKIRKGDNRIRIANVDSKKFPARDLEIPQGGAEAIEIDATVHEWSNYFKAGLRGASELLAKKNGGSGKFVSVGMDVLVDGSVPAGGGLSSSAAFVCASALAVMRANGEETVDKTELTELAIVSERAVGVNSGGLVPLLSSSSSIPSSLDSQLTQTTAWTNLPPSSPSATPPSSSHSSPRSPHPSSPFPKRIQNSLLW